jgi:hypothetical protein
VINKLTYRTLCLLILFCFNGIAVFAKSVQKIKFKPNFRDNYKGVEFNYYEEKIDDSVWRGFIEWISRILYKMFDIQPNSINPENIDLTIKIICGIVILIVVLLIVKTIVKGNHSFNLFKKNKDIDYHTEIVENIHEIDFNERINQAISEQNYRLAVRYHYLWMLKKLTDRKVILWHPQKTNSEYLYEIQSDNELIFFKKSCYYYDYIWYGEFEIDLKKYAEVEQHFKQIK